jgi:hypothetical protein
MAQTALRKGPVAGDWLIREDLSREYDSESVTMSNATGSPIIIPSGAPITSSTAGVDSTWTLTAGINTFTSVLLEATTLVPGASKQKVAVIGRLLAADTQLKGTGCTVNFNALPTADSAAAGYVAADFKARLAALGFVVRTEPTKQEEQVK